MVILFPDKSIKAKNVCFMHFLVVVREKNLSDLHPPFPIILRTIYPLNIPKTNFEFFSPISGLS